MTRYDLGAEIARGGMGRVVDARDNLLGRRVAVKQATATDPDSLRRFAREIQITARLEHPAIVPVHDAGTLDTGEPYYVMRKIAGEGLDALIHARAELDRRLVLVPNLAIAANAIAHAHDRGVLHRDIKPSNILVGTLGETIVIDWGIAKLFASPGSAAARSNPEWGCGEDIDEPSEVGIVLGTPGFVAPECARGEPASPQTDVWSLGATLYYLLARRTPHDLPDADATIAATGEGPAPAIDDLVDGVPAELAAIVTTACAFDAAARYRSARALAEDLERFLDGRLVAAHHYSPWQRLGRFVRRNVAAVAVACVALAAGATGAVIAVERIVAERDRADAERVIAVAEKAEAERRRSEASDRADQLALGEARALATTDPTAAVAALKPLASKWWREARAIGEAARAAGVAYGYPAAPHTSSLDLISAPPCSGAAHPGQAGACGGTGDLALALGDDSALRIYDLAKRTTRELGSFAGAEAARFVDPGRVVVAASGRLAVIDLETGAKRMIDTPDDIVATSLAASPGQLVWIDRAGAAWRLDLASGAPQKLAIDEPVRAVVPAPLGDLVAVAGAQHLYIVGADAAPVASGVATSLAWLGRDRLAALVGDRALDIDATTKATRDAGVGDRSAIALVDNALVVLGPSGLATVAGDQGGATPRRPLSGYALGLGCARGNVAVAAAARGELALTSADGDATIATARLPVQRFATARDSHFVVAAVAGHVLAWDVDDVLPRRVLDDRPASVAFAGADHAVVATGRDTRWLELAGPRPVAIVDATPAFVELAASPSGDRAVVGDLAHRGRVVGPGRAVVELGPTGIEHAVFVDNTRLLAGGGDGVVHLYDTDHGSDAVVTHRSAGVIALASNATDLAAAFADKVIVRRPLAGDSDDTLTLAAPASALAFAGDGTLVIAARDELHAWTGGPHEVVLAKLPRPVIGLEVDDLRVAALGDDGEAFTVTLAGTDLRQRFDDGAPARALARAAGLYAATPVPTELAVYDPFVGASWPVGRAINGATFEQPRISDDGNRVLAIVPTGVLAWHVELPRTAAATVAWLGHLTNAVATGAAARLEWR